MEVTEKNTKAEILKAYEALLQNIQEAKAKSMFQSKFKERMRTIKANSI